MKNKNIKKIHFVGIKGVGMTPLAIIAKEAGFIVTGSDVAEPFITDIELTKSGINPFIGFSKENVRDVDLVIATGAHGGTENIEVKEAVNSNISVLTQGDALGIFQDGEIFGKKYKGICIAGSHGKTTTTAIIATILKENNLNPSYAIGTGEIPSLGLSGHFGQGKYFVAEADEYFADVVNNKTPKFLFLNPFIVVITNVDYDHPDIYESVGEISDALLEFAKKIPPDGVLIVNGDGEENRKFIASFNGRKITYGFSPNNDYILERVNSSPEKMFFWIKSKETILGEFSMQIFGEQNAQNALAAIIVGLEIGLPIEKIKKGLSKFKGTKRRSEFIGNLESGGLVYDDYAHHPKEIKETLSAFKKSFPKFRIITIFQPHMYSRTKKLFNDFSNSFPDSDEVLITEIFPSFREKKDPDFSSSLLVQEIKKFGKNAIYFPALSDVVKYVTSQKYGKNTLVITMGAGDIYKVGEKLLDG
ncbi:MAG: UDP-N-acetylmuramate--L-alanine ligase [Patescibacteria group bacterium]